MKRTIGITVIALGMTLGCMTEQKPEARPATVSLLAEVPVISPLPETKQSQEKGGVEISVAAVEYRAVQGTAKSRRQVQPTFGELLIKHRDRAVMVETTYTPVFHVAPERLRFTVKLNNKLSRVFRAGGTVVQFNVAGKLASVDQSGYADLTSAIVPPRGEQQVEVFGPPIKEIPPSSTIGLFFYDVPTKTDAAGNITEKQNFEWYFKFATQQKEEAGAVRTERTWE